MTKEELQDEYDKHHTIEGLEGVDMEGHLAGLVAVARLQAEHDERQRLQLTPQGANLTPGQKEETSMKSTSRIVKEAMRESRFPLMVGVSSRMVDVVKRAMHVVAHEVQRQDSGAKLRRDIELLWSRRSDNGQPFLEYQEDAIALRVLLAGIEDAR